MSKISVPIIMKNESKVLERCLKSVQQFADEIIIVDTGSTDNSIEIAKRFTPYVYVSEHFDKNTHFSDFEFGVARNEAIKRCTSQWICWWDCDDVIDAVGASKIKRIVQEAKSNFVCNFSIIHGSIRFDHARLFPNGLGIMFDETHACHEFLVLQDLPAKPNRDIVIQHLPIPGGLSSCERNLAILEKDHFQRGRKDQRTLFYLANAYRECGRDEEAIGFYDMYLGISEWTEERFFARMYKGKCLCQMKNWIMARNEFLCAIIEDDRFAEVYCGLGDVYFVTGRYELAMRWYNMAYGLKIPSDSILFISQSQYREYPKAKIKECIEMLAKQSGRHDDLSDMLTTMDVSVRANSGLSEAIMASAVVKAYIRNNAGSRITLYVDEEQASLLGNLEQEGIEVTARTAPEEGVLQLELPKNLAKRSERHCLDWYCRSMGFVSEEIPMPIVSITGTAERKAAEQYGDNIVVIQTRPDFNGGAWSVTHWESLVDLISSKGLKVYQADKECDAVAGAELLPEDDIELVKAVVSRAKLVVCVDGWLQHLAATFGKLVFVMWGSTVAKNRGYPNQVGFAIKDLDCQPCWGKWDGVPEGSLECKNQFTCMRVFDPDSVFNHIGKVLAEFANQQFQKLEVANG